MLNGWYPVHRYDYRYCYLYWTENLYEWKYFKGYPYKILLSPLVKLHTQTQFTFCNKTVCKIFWAINYIPWNDINRNEWGVVNYFTACCHSFSWEIARAIKIQPTTLVCKQIVIIYQHYYSYKKDEFFFVKDLHIWMIRVDTIFFQKH